LQLSQNLNIFPSHLQKKVNLKKNYQLFNALLLIVSIALVSCFGKEHGYNFPVKPKEIPDEAFWIGGTDGGNWYLIESVDKLRKEASIDVYSDRDGELLISKIFKIDCTNEDGIDWDHLKDQIQSFDGNKIMLEVKGRWYSRYCYFE
jgi:hypothetical protein